MRASFIASLLCLSAALLLTGCAKIAQSVYLAVYERDIAGATKAIESAGNSVQRASGYSERGKAYSEKARYSRAFKLISPEEYGRLFSLAIQDHDQAIALDPASAEAHYARGHTYYDRAALDVEEHKDGKAWFAPAAADFQKAIEKNSRLSMAYDMLGLVHLSTGELDLAIDDFTREMALDPLGKSRLADAYCDRGGANYKERKYDAAIADYEKSIETCASSDGCSCDPYNPLIGLYANNNRQYDKAWELVHRAQASRKWLAPELLDQLKRDSANSSSSTTPRQ